MVRLLYILLFFVSNGVVAQDLIVKRSGEVIYCNIESVEDYYIHFYELGDTSRALLYKMDAAIVKKIVFGGDDQLAFLDQSDITTSEAISGSYIMLETNIDGLFNDFLSLHFQYLKQKYAFDIGFKRFYSSANVSFEAIDHKGSMVELGFSLPMNMFGKKDRPMRGLYIRGYGIFTTGNFRNVFQSGGIIEYNQLSFGVQGVLHYQITKSFYVKMYFGLGGTKQVESFAPSIRRADLSGGNGLQNIYGMRIGYVF